LVTWDCYAEQLIASNTSTIYTRILKIWKKRKQQFRDVKKRDKKILLQVAALYAINHSDYFMDRALAVLHRPKVLAKVVSFFVRKLDDKFWFVYRQVCLQTHWLTFQSHEISDKSSKRVYRHFMSEDIDWWKNRVLIGAFETASDDRRQIRFRETQYEQFQSLRDRISDPLVLAFFEDWSEPDT
jgi:hypothetical protein